ncbi:MAG: ATP-binding protein [Nocardioides sp.]|nr:ATP-binding protein [Nocardioides sp.]
MTETWRAENAVWLLTRLERLRLRIQRQVTTESEPALDESIRVLGNRLDLLEEQMAAGSGRPALRVLSTVAGLSPEEEELLLVAAAPALDGSFARDCAELHQDGRRDHATPQLALELVFPEPTRRLVAADHLMPHGTLRLLRLVELADEDDEPLLLRRLSVDDRMADYLRGVNRPDAALEPFLQPLHSTGDSTHAESLSERVVELLQQDTAHWPTVNLIGAPDAGSEAVVDRVCAALGLRPWLLDLERLSHLEPRERTALLSRLARETLLGWLALVVDTGTARGDAGQARAIGQLVDELACPLFLLSQDRWPTESREVRVVHLTRPSVGEQRTLWRAALDLHPHTVNGEIESIVHQFDFGPGTISQVVARAAYDTAEPITGELLWDACRGETAGALDDVAQRIEPCFGWDDIVVADLVRGQLHKLASQVQHRSTVYEDWGFGERLSRGRGITALFAGPSGTGKTMAAEILAAHLRLDLHRVDLAGVVSKYVGETEKNLRRIFDTAERTGTILLFDEADALFGSRTEVRDSHDRYANLEINYLLQRMEDYTGLAILATNRRTALDTAFLRRLRFVVEFAFPGPDHRRRIWERAFPAAAALDEVDPGLLSRMEITGGNIRSIAVNAAFLAADDRSSIGMEHLMRAAAREYAKLSKPVSAVEFGDWVDVMAR